jgi:nitroreductase
MEFQELINTRRSFRSLESAEITGDLIKQLYESVKLTPSCYNNQPWRFICVYGSEQLEKLKETLPDANNWAKKASMIIAVTSKKELDCMSKDGRNYYLFDTGMATFSLILKLTDLGFVAHPIAGYVPEKVKTVLNIENDLEIITIIIVGKKAKELNPDLKDFQIQSEQQQPTRKSFSEIFSVDVFSNELLQDNKK